MEGFIPLRRSLFNHFLFTETRVLSRFEAWLDLIQMATYQEEHTRIIKGKTIVCGKGQLIASIRFLEQRWSWSRHKVCDFFELLRSQQMLSLDNENGLSRITLINFKKYNEINFLDGERDDKRDSKNRNGKRKAQHEGTAKGTEAGQSGDSEGTNTNKDNKDNKVNSESANPAAAGTLTLEDRFKNFQDWISKNAPQVRKLRDSFTREQYESIRKQYPIEVITEVLVAMHNRKSLLKDYVSAYLTCLQWIKIREERGQNKKGMNGTKAEQQQTTNVPKAAEVLSKFD